MILAVNSAMMKQADQITRYLANLSWDQLWQHLANRLLSIVLITILFFVILAFGRLLINYLFKRAHHQLIGANRWSTIHALTLNIFRYTCFFFYLYALLSLLGIPVGTLIAGAGIFSIALGLGAQGFVSDVVNGFFILVEQQFDVGDEVKVGNIRGQVSALGLRTTQITGADGTLNYIPNRSITIVTNYSRHNLTANVDVPLSPDADMGQVNQQIKRATAELVDSVEGLAGEPQLIGPVHDGDNLVFRVVITAKSGQQNKVASQFLAKYLQVLHQ